MKPIRDQDRITFVLMMIRSIKLNAWTPITVELMDESCKIQSASGLVSLRIIFRIRIGINIEKKRVGGDQSRVWIGS